VPAFALVGGENKGWKAATTHLELEHGAGGRIGKNRVWERLLRYCQETKRDGIPLAQHQDVRDALADIYAKTEVQRLFGLRNFWLTYAKRPRSYEGPQLSYYRKMTGLWMTRAILEAVGPAALTTDPTRPPAPTIRTLSIIVWLQFPSGIPGDQECSAVPLRHGNAQLEVCLDRRPLVVGDAVPGAVAVLSAPHQHVSAVNALEGRSEREQCSSRALVLRVRLELDTPAPPRHERVPQLEELRLDVDARTPGGRVEPRPADLDRTVLRSQREEPRRADNLPAADRHKRDLTAGHRRVERRQDERVPLVAGLRLDEVEPGPGARVPRGEPQTLFVLGRQRLEPNDAALEDRNGPPLHRSRQYTRHMPIYEYACMECESHFEELVRSGDQAVTCPECGARKDDFELVEI